MRQFHHVGVITTQPQPGEIFVPATKVYVTNPNEHPDRIEYLRFEADTPVTGPLRESPHIAFKVPKLEPEMAKGQVLAEPFEPMKDLRVCFVLIDGAVFEFMEFMTPNHFFDGLGEPASARRKPAKKAGRRGAKGKPRAKAKGVKKAAKKKVTRRRRR